MTPADLDAIRARDAKIDLHPGGIWWSDSEVMPALRDRRVLLAEVDRLQKVLEGREGALRMAAETAEMNAENALTLGDATYSLRVIAASARIELDDAVTP